MKKQKSGFNKIALSIIMLTLFFTNILSAFADTATAKLEITAKANLTNGVVRKGWFKFTLSDGSDTIVQSLSNDENGDIVFANRVFGTEGRFIYTLRQIKGSEKDITYDESVYTITVDVTKKPDNSLSKTVSLEKDSKPYDGDLLFTNIQKVPDTGDNTQSMAYSVMGAGVIMFILSKINIGRKEV